MLSPSCELSLSILWAALWQVCDGIIRCSWFVAPGSTHTLLMSPGFSLRVIILSVSCLPGMVNQLSLSLTVVPEVSLNHTVKTRESPVGISFFQNLESWAYHLRAEEFLGLDDSSISWWRLPGNFCSCSAVVSSLLFSSLLWIAPHPPVNVSGLEFQSVCL